MRWGARRGKPVVENDFQHEPGGDAGGAGIAVGFWDGAQEVTGNWAESKRWTPDMDRAEADRLFRNWKKAVTRTFDWVDEDVVE